MKTIDILELTEKKEELQEYLFNSFIETFPNFEEVDNFNEIPFDDDCIKDWEHLNRFIIQEIEEIEEIEKYCPFGSYLIPEEDFEEHCKDLVSESLNINLPWFIKIDWEETTQNILVDYTEIIYNNNTYYFR